MAQFGMNAQEVTPHVGVWIETVDVYLHVRSELSLPTWECGLKRTILITTIWTMTSLPTWECGLKRLDGRVLALVSGVTPHVGVWIETIISSLYFSRPACHSPRGSVD